MNIQEHEQCRLEDIVHSGEAICLYRDRHYKSTPGVFWSAYSHPETNEVIVRGQKGTLAYFHSAPSRFLRPSMRDRTSRIHALDNALAQKLCIQMWATVGWHLFLHQPQP